MNSVIKPNIKITTGIINVGTELGEVLALLDRTR